MSSKTCHQAGHVTIRLYFFVFEKNLQVNSKKENDDILKFLNESDFGENGKPDHIWLGMNSGKYAGNYVIDNSRSPIDWLNWDQSSDQNENGSKNSIKMNTATGTWFRTTNNDFAAAICSKPTLS